MTSRTHPSSLVFAGVWLLFLALPVGFTLAGDASTAWKAIGLIATAAFALVYLWIFWRCPYIRPGQPVPVGYVVALGALTVLAALAVPAAGGSATAFCCFLAAAVVFQLPLRVGIPLGLLPWALASTLALATAQVAWVVLGPTFGVLIIVIMRFADHAEERRRGVDEHLRRATERDAIARDVHDVLGHSLTVLSIKAQLARRLLDDDPERAGEELAQIDALSREALTQVRSTVTRLHAPRLEDELTAARTALAAAEIDARIHVAGDLPDESDLLAWAVREGVTNAVRHSSAGRCEITVEPRRLRIVDDGVGFDPTEAGNGLQGLRERMREAGARFDVRPAQPATSRPGTALEVVLP